MGDARRPCAWGALAGALLFSVTLPASAGERGWVVDTGEQWKKAKASAENLRLGEGKAEPTADRARFVSVVKQYDQPRSAERIRFRQDGVWKNWKPTKVGSPSGTRNAPVFLPVGDGNYWYFAEKQGAGPGYHAWHSSDMKEWVHKGQVTESRWVTSVEHADGKFYIYYDKPNDEDPHLIIDEDLTDSSKRKVGEVFADPSHGSDSGVFRAADGSFHLIYENWSASNIQTTRSADSPIAGHTKSPDGIRGFEPRELPAPIDERKDKPQDVFGDYTITRVGPRYYIFCDYHPPDGPIRIGHWFSESLEGEFEWGGGGIGKGFHPDPTMGFAEGRFYLVVQRHRNFVSRGPWADGVEARAGVDKDGDGKVDAWTEWQAVRAEYARKKGFSRIVEREPASIDLRSLPAGRGFRFAFRTESEGKRNRAVMDRVHLSLE